MDFFCGSGHAPHGAVNYSCNFDYFEGCAQTTALLGSVPVALEEKGREHKDRDH